MIDSILKLGTRGSKLAQVQADCIIALLEKFNPGVEFQKQIIKTEGDLDLIASLDKIGGNGLFVRTIEQKLLSGEIDIAVHSAKDLPSIMTEGLQLSAVPLRAPYNDVFVSRSKTKLTDLPKGSLIGTSSPRRRAMLLNFRSGFKFIVIRGNVDTRITKMNDGACDAMIMAEAGLDRLGLQHHIAERLPTESFLPAPGQGFMAVQIRRDEHKIASLVNKIDNPFAHRCLNIERLLLAKLNAGCSSAIGGLATIESDRQKLQAVVLDNEGRIRLYAEHENKIELPIDNIVDNLIGKLYNKGAAEIIAEQNEK